MPLEDFYEPMIVERPARVPGTAVYLTGNDTGTPPALFQGVRARAGRARTHAAASFLTRTLSPRPAFFGIPPSRVMEIGSPIEI